MENEEPYFTCQAKGPPQPALIFSRPITITIEDVNDPPIFLPDIKNIRVMEDSPVGTPLDKFTADDHDSVYASSFE